MTTTFRKDTTTGLVALAEAFKAANPTLLLKVYPRRPTGFTGDLPCAYVGSKNEDLSPTVGRWQRSMEPQLVLVCNPTGSEEEKADEVDVLTDAFLDYCNDRPHAIGSNRVAWPRNARDVELEVDDVVYPAVVITFTNLAAEGRG